MLIKPKYMVIPGDQNEGRSHIIKTDNNSFERVEQFRYLGTIVPNQKSIQEEIKSRLKSGNSCNRSVLNLLSSTTLIINQQMYYIKNFTLKHLKSFRHVSILISSSGSYVLPC